VIETEHLLLGIVREDKTLMNRFLRSHVESIRKQVESHSVALPNKWNKIANFWATTGLFGQVEPVDASIAVAAWTALRLHKGTARQVCEPEQDSRPVEITEAQHRLFV
jgi:hypothetical protein